MTWKLPWENEKMRCLRSICRKKKKTWTRQEPYRTTLRWVIHPLTIKVKPCHKKKKIGTDFTLIQRVNVRRCCAPHWQRVFHREQQTSFINRTFHSGDMNWWKCLLRYLFNRCRSAVWMHLIASMNSVRQQQPSKAHKAW